ncbi:MAG TPA: hypothetical protein VF998_07635 [Candidatus Limnocylindria bacterium]
MKRTTWPKVFAYTGIAVIGLVLAYYATAVANSGIGARALGRSSEGGDLFSAGSIALLVGIAAFAVFGYLALVGARAMMREGR